MAADTPVQGEVWWTYFEEGWERPAVVISRDELNRGRLLLVVPCTSSRVDERVAYRNHVLLPAGTAGLTRDSAAQVHLIQPVETSLLQHRLGALDAERLREILLAIAWTVDLFDIAGTI